MTARLAAVVFAVLAIFAATPASFAQKQVPETRMEIQLSYAPVVKRVAPAVVNIYTRKVIKTRQVAPLFNDPFFRRFFGDRFGVPQGPEQSRKVQNSLGSGVIVRPDGIVVTNRHVIEGADEITVVLADKREYPAEILGQDESTDLAVLKIDTKGEPLAALELRDSDELEVGDLVLAVGDPFGVGQTVTSGIVSAVARTGVGISDLGFFIQTDAAINPGNSGGALVTLDGRLVGINTAIFSKSGGSHGIGFAIPSNMVRFVVAGFMKGKELVRPWLGASGQPVTAELANALGLRRPVGVLVSELYSGGPAERAGLRRGDVVVAVNGREVADGAALKYRIGVLEVGGKVTVTVWRRGAEGRAQVRDLTMALEAPPEEPPRNLTRLSGRQPLSGTVIVNMNPALSVELGIDVFEAGVYVFEIDKRGAAARFGIRPGDRIEKINGVHIRRVKDVVGALKEAGGHWEIELDRGGRSFTLSIGQ
jgi:serine protease Do